MPPAQPIQPTKKHLAKVERERRAKKALLIGSGVVFLAIVGVIVYGILQTQYLPPIQPVAIVNGEEIKTKDFQARVRYERNNLVKQYQNIYQTMQTAGNNEDIQKYFKQNLDEIKSQLDPQQLGERMLETMIADTLIRQEAAKRGIEVTEEEVDRAIQEEFGFFPTGQPTSTSTSFPTLLPTSTLSALQKTLMPEFTPTITPTEAITATPTNTPTQTLIPSPTSVPSITPTPTVYTLEKYKRDYQFVVETYKRDADFSEEELRGLVKTELLKNKLMDAVTKDIPVTQEKVWARHILVKDEATAQNVLKRLQAGEDWFTVAKEVSEDTGSKDNGGDLGWFGRGVMIKEFEDAAFNLKIGEISKPVKTTFGWHIIQCLGHENRSLNAYEYQQAKSAEFQKYLEKLRKEADVKIFDYWKERVPTTPALPEGLS